MSTRSATPRASRVSGLPFGILTCLLLFVIVARFTSASAESKIYRDNVCGATQFSFGERIAGGNLADEGDWPWHGALFFGKDYKCGCSLISEWFVLTAGHCVFNPDTGYKFDIKQLRVVLGLLELNLFQPHTREFQVKQVIAHPKFTAENHKHDLALLLLNKAVEFSEMIRPIKLDESKPSFIEKVAGSQGKVVGWGFTEKDRISEQLMTAEMVIARYTDCIESNPDLFGQLIHGGMYCAGAENGTNVCNGDSGGGMYIFQNNSWYLRGLVSFSALRDGTNLCDLFSYAAFTNLPHYMDWIHGQLQEHQRKLLDEANRKSKMDDPNGAHIGLRLDTVSTTTTQPSTTTMAYETQPIHIHPPECLQQYDKIVIVEYNSSISLVCDYGSGNSDPHQSIRWFRESRYFQEVDLSSEIGFSETDVHDILTLRHMDASHSGRYFCRAQLPSANVTDRRIISVMGVVPQFKPVAGKPAYMKFDVYLKQEYFSLVVTFRADREDGILLFRSDEWNHQIMMLFLENGKMELSLLTEKKTMRKVECEGRCIKLGKWHTVRIKCYLGRCLFALDSEMQALFHENLFLTDGTNEYFYLGGAPSRNESGFTGCISQMVLNDYPINLRKEAIKSERISQCNHCTVNTCQNGGICVETMDSDASRCLCPDGFTGRTCSNVGECCRAMSCVEALCKNFESGFRCACSSTRAGARCENINVLNGQALSFRSFGYTKYAINLEKHFYIRFQFSPRNVKEGTVALLLEDNRGTGNFLALVLDNGALELRFTVELDVTVFKLRSSITLTPSAWYSVIAGYQNELVYLQVNGEPDQSKDGFKELFNQQNDHYLYLGGAANCMAWGQCPERPSDFDGCVKEFILSGRSIDLTGSFIDARNVENCKINVP